MNGHILSKESTGLRTNVRIRKNYKMTPCSAVKPRAPPKMTKNQKNNKNPQKPPLTQPKSKGKKPSGGSGGKSLAAAASSSSSGNKRSSTFEKGESSMSSVTTEKVVKKAVREVDAPKDMIPACCLCSKMYRSWKALFGHFRAHPERTWRGAFPPPTFTPEGSPGSKGNDNGSGNNREVLQEQLAPTLFTLAQKALANLNKEGECSGGREPRVVLDLDLNDVPAEEAKKDLGFDLNMLPPESEDDDAGEK